MPKTFYAVVERYPGGVNVIPYKSLKKAETRFQVILRDILPPDEEVDEKMVDKATKEQYWSTCEGDSDQEIILEIQTLEWED
jgi:hypothetical protein